jgi:uncharacterized membrane protein YczE
MKITREKHLNYIGNLMPYLFMAYVVQCFLYLQFAPRELAMDVSLFLGIGIVLIALCFATYDQLHSVHLYKHHLLITIDLIKYREEILYSHIHDIAVNSSSHAFYNITLTLWDGRRVRLYYLDDVDELKRNIRNFWPDRS